MPYLLSHPRWRKLVAVVLSITAILALSYLLAANVVLRTRLLRNLVSRPSRYVPVGGAMRSVTLDYESAYSIVPGRVHVEGLSIRGRARTVEWRLTLDHADVAVSLVDLLRRSFHATRVRADGLTMRARLRLDRENANPDVIAALPPIAGFDDPPFLDEAPEPPQPPDASKPWMVHLEDVDVQRVREVWILTLRSEGDTRVRGRWIFRPQEWLDVGPAMVDSNGVAVFYGTQTLATGASGSFGVTVHPFDLQQVKGLAIFDHVSGSGPLRGYAIVAGAMRLLALWSGVTFKQWEGPIEGRVVLDHGNVAEGTRVRIDATDCDINADGLAFRTPIRTEFGVDGGLGTLDTRGSGLRVSRLGVERARAASIGAALTSRQLRIADFFDDAHFTLDVGGAETNDVGAWKDHVPSTVVIGSGLVTADGHADGSLAEKRARAELHLLARRLSVEQGDDQFTADLRLDAKLLDASFAEKWAIGVATIAAENSAVRLGRGVLAGTAAVHVDLRRWNWANRTVDLSGSNVVLRTVSVRSTRGGESIVLVPSFTAVAPRFAIAPSGTDGHVLIDLPLAELVDLAALRELLPLPPSLTIEAGRGQGKLHADVELGSGSIRGEGGIVVRGIRARVSKTEFFGDLDCAVSAQRVGSAEGSTDLSGSTLAIANAGTGNAAPSEDAWWGNLALREATLRTKGGVRFAAKLHLAAKDASPATALLSQNTAVPTWAANVFKMPALHADAQLRVAPSSFELRSLFARGGSTSLRAEYAKRDGRKDGGVLMDLGWIDVGYDLADGSTGLVLVGPEGWFERKTATMRDAAAAATRKTDTAEQALRYEAMTPELRKDEARTIAARCTLEARSCDGMSIDNLLRTATDAAERDTLSGIMYAPMVIAAAKGGKDGATLDPLVMGSLAEAFRIGGESTLDNIPSTARLAAASNSDAARGKLITVTGRASLVRRDGPYAVGMLTTDAEPVYFVTPFANHRIPENPARFRGVFVQQYSPADQSQNQRPSLVVVGAFSP